MGHQVSPRPALHDEEMTRRYCACDDDDRKGPRTRAESANALSRRNKEQTDKGLYPNLSAPEDDDDWCENCCRPKKPFGYESKKYRAKDKSSALKDQSSASILFYACILAIIAIALYFIWPSINGDANMQSVMKPSMEFFNQNFNVVKEEEGDSVNREIWPHLISSARFVLKRDPAETPAVIALIALKDAYEEACRIAMKFCKTMTKIYNDDGIVEIHGGRKEDVKVIHGKITGVLGKRKTHAVIVYEFDKLSNDTAMSFHGFFDDENAPFKEAFYILIIRSEIVESDGTDLENFDATFRWVGEVTKDKLSSLESRIRTKVFVRKP